MGACPESYGIVINEPFIEDAHDRNDRHLDEATGFWLAKDQLKWLIKKNDLILSGEILERRCVSKHVFPVSGPREGSIFIYSCRWDEPPPRLSKNGMLTSLFLWILLY